jgi:hypothetical protein
MVSSKLVKFLKLPRHKKRVFFAAFWILWLFRIRLWVLPYAFIKKQASGMKVESTVGKHSVEDIVWSVEIANKFVLNATCLTQALAAKKLLSRNGYSSALWIGVDSCNGFAAHAWIERGGSVILGGPTNQYKPLYILG